MSADTTQRVPDPAELAAGYLFPELFETEPLHPEGTRRSQEAEDTPFRPSAVVQPRLPGMPPVDWEHVRQREAAQRRKRQRRRS